MSEYYTILTDVGKAKIANSLALGKQVNFDEFAVGDGNGAMYHPTETQTELKNEVWRGKISVVQQDESNPNRVIVAVAIPGNVGGFYVREGGMYDDEGDLLAICRFSESHKPTVDQGAVKDMWVKSVLLVSNASSITMKIDPTVIIATLKDLNALESKMRSEIKVVADSLIAHKNDEDAHGLGEVRESINDIENRAFGTEGINLYVNASIGDDTNDGSESSPFKTIQRAVDCSQRYGKGHSIIINISEGTYVENIEILGLSVQTIVLLGINKSSTIINGTIATLRLFNISIKNITINVIDANSHGISFNSIIYAQLIDSQINHCSKAQGGGGNGIVTTGSKVIVQRTNITGAARGCNVDYTSELLLQSCVLNNLTYGAYVYNAARLTLNGCTKTSIGTLAVLSPGAIFMDNTTISLGITSITN